MEKDDSVPNHNRHDERNAPQVAPDDIPGLGGSSGDPSRPVMVHHGCRRHRLRSICTAVFEGYTFLL